MLGHTSIQVTMRYVHPAEEQKKIAAGKLEAFRIVCPCPFFPNGPSSWPQRAMAIRLTIRPGQKPLKYELMFATTTPHFGGTRIAVKQ